MEADLFVLGPWSPTCLESSKTPQRRRLKKRRKMKECCFCLNSWLIPRTTCLTVSPFWGTEEWRSLQQAANLELYNVNQWVVNPGKPMLRSSRWDLLLILRERKNEGQKVPSSSLSRWVPGLFVAPSLKRVQRVSMKEAKSR